MAIAAIFSAGMSQFYDYVYVMEAEIASVSAVSSAPSNGLAACLVIKDDNDRLVEWIAYHYQVLPLRFLVVGVDHTIVQV